MPKSRKRNTEKGAKSIGIRTKFKIGGRKSSQGAEQMSNAELQEKLSSVRKRDRNSLLQTLRNRGLI